MKSSRFSLIIFKCFCCFILCYSTLPTFLDASIVRTNMIIEVLSHVDANTWVFFDFDDTVLMSQMQIGRPEYYPMEFGTLRSQGFDEEMAHGICRLHWNEMQEKFPVMLTEASVFDVVIQSQRTAAYTIGLTARGPQTNLVTQKQLQSLSLDFSKSSPTNISIDLPFRHLYESGVWYVEFNEKGFSVRKWLEKISNWPEKIVFVDDRLHHLENMQKELSKLGIEFIGIHYCKALENPFIPQIAQIQAKYFPMIVSDQEALELLKSSLDSRIPKKLSNFFFFHRSLSYPKN